MWSLASGGSQILNEYQGRIKYREYLVHLGEENLNLLSISSRIHMKHIFEFINFAMAVTIKRSISSRKRSDAVTLLISKKHLSNWHQVFISLF